MKEVKKYVLCRSNEETDEILNIFYTNSEIETFNSNLGFNECKSYMLLGVNTFCYFPGIEVLGISHNHLKIEAKQIITFLDQCKETNIELYSKILDLININKIGVKDEIFDIVYREIHNL